MMKSIIIKNQIKCNHCGDIIESTSRHDFKECSCGAVSIDGGHDYLRRSFVNSSNDYTDMSVCQDVYEDLDIEDIRYDDIKKSEDKYDDMQDFISGFRNMVKERLLDDQTYL